MNNRQFLHAAVLTGFALILSGCGSSESPAQAMAPLNATPTPAPVARPSRLTVVGIDCSGSYAQMVEKGQRIATQLVGQAEPGDQIIVRWISDRSYQSDQAVAHIHIPAAPAELPQPNVDERNRFDPRSRKLLALWHAREAQRKQAFLTQLQALKAAEIARLNALVPVVASNTDIFGFIASAADLFQERGSPDAEYHLVLVTDLKDTVNRSISPPDLAGVEVAIWGILTDADPQAAQRLREKWQRYFLQETQAATVELRSADLLLK